MAKIVTRTKNTIIVNRFLVGQARKALATLVSEHKGTLSIGTNGFYTATFEEVETATRVADALNAQYAEHGVRMPEPKQVKGDAPKAEKKMTLNDFIKANPSCTREEARAYGFEGKREDLKNLKKKLGVR